MSGAAIEGGRRNGDGGTPEPEIGAATSAIHSGTYRRQPDTLNAQSPSNLPPSALRPPPSPSSFLAHAARLWYTTLYGPCFAISKVLFHYRYAGRPHVPLEGPVLIVSNHQSNLDPVLIGLACPRQLKYFARVGLFFWPFSWWIRALGAVPINRENAIGGIKTTLKLLKQGEAVVVFPEGSRTFDGEMAELLPGFCVLARRSGATIVPTAIDGAFHALPRGSFCPRLAEISLVICPSITPREIAAMSDEQLTKLVVDRIRGALQGGIFAEQPGGMEKYPCQESK